MAEVKAPKPLGRPKETVEQRLSGNWKSSMLSLYEKGASDVEVRATLGKEFDKRGYISDDLWYRWIEEEPDFSRTVKAGKLLSELWWQAQGRVNLENKDFSATLWYMNMKNRFGWRDKQDFTTDGQKINISVVDYSSFAKKEEGE